MSYKSFVSRLFAYLKPHLGKLVITTILMVMATALESSIPEITGQIVDELFAKDKTADKTVFYSVLIFSVFVLSSILNLSSNVISSWVSNQVVTNIRIDMFERLLKLPKSYFDKYNSGNLISKLTFDVEQIAAVSSSIWLLLVKSVLTVVILVGYLFYKNWQLSISLILILPLIYLAVKYSARRMHHLSKDVQNSMGNLTHLLDENISGNSIIKIFQAQEQENIKFNKEVKNIRQKRVKVDITALINTNLINILLGLALAFVVYFSSSSLQMSGGEFLSYFTALAMLIKPAKTLINMNKPLQISFAAGESVFGLLDESEEQNIGKLKPKKILGKVRFDDVSFSYNDNKKILDSISFEIKKGQTIAIVGPTGSGKTTITELISKFYTNYQGNIYIDDIDLKELDIDSLRSNLSLVDQNTRLFNDSVKNNILLGRSQKISDNDLYSIAEKSEALDFINKLPNKFDTFIGDDGKLLSGGQRQRIAIARSIAKNSPILILDEATSALDSSTEKLVQKAIKNLTEDRTTIIIAHRLSTIQKADWILVLKNGEIIEQGKHNDLIQMNGFYSQLIQDQF